MSCSSLWVMDKEYNGSVEAEFQNSWYFSPIVWDILLDKYMHDEIQTPYGYKKSFMSDNSLFPKLNEIINNCNCMPDRICWEMSNQQVFFTKNKEVICNSIKDFIKINSNYDKDKEDNISPLEREHIIERFNEIADEILQLNENESPYFIFKNTSCDDNVEYWFSKYDENEREYNSISLKEQSKRVTEFVIINGDDNINFISNLDYKYS